MALFQASLPLQNLASSCLAVSLPLVFSQPTIVLLLLQLQLAIVPYGLISFLASMANALFVSSLVSSWGSSTLLENHLNQQKPLQSQWLYPKPLPQCAHH